MGDSFFSLEASGKARSTVEGISLVKVKQLVLV